MQQYRSEIEAFTNPDHAQTLRDGRDAGLENPEREELENLLKAKVAELVMGLYRAEIAHLTVESMNLDAGLRNRVTSDTRIEAPNKVVLIQELGARLEVLRAVAERQLTIAAIGSDQLD